MKNFLSKRKDVKFKLENFQEALLPEAINRLSYGFKVYKYVKKKSQKHIRIFYLLDDDYRFLQWISPKKMFTKSRINLSDIKDLSREVPQGIKKKSICLKISTQSVEIILDFATELDRDYFQYGIQYFTVQAAHHEFLEKRQDQVKHLANILFLNADKDGNKQLSLEETKRLLQELHISVNRKYLKKLFETYDINQNGQIDQSEFIRIIRDISKKEELQQVFKKFCPEYVENSRDQESLMSIQQYQNFMREEQHQDITIPEITELFKNATNQIFIKSDNPKILNTLKISFYQFSNFAFSLENSIFDSRLEELYQDMDRPLSDYFVNSSHNTYLMANQLTSDSSCQAYINAFLNGCRCVEIDCWDGEKGEPIVYHGHTLTSKILFKDVVETIDKYGFMMSPFPVILSFENHCSLEQTKKMAFYLKSIFKEKLFLVPKDYEKFEYYLSPNQLRGKILIKSKGTVEKAVNENSVLGFVSDSDEEQEDEGDSQTDIQILNNLNNIIPDYSHHEQYLKNQTDGKKKLIFQQKDVQEQKEILKKISQKFVQEKSKPPLNNNSKIQSISSSQIVLLQKPSLQGHLFTEDIMGGELKLSKSSQRGDTSELNEVKKDQKGTQHGIDSISDDQGNNEELTLVKEQKIVKLASESKYSREINSRDINSISALEDLQLSKNELDKTSPLEKLNNKLPQEFVDNFIASKQAFKGINQKRQSGTEEPTIDCSINQNNGKHKKKIKECKEFLEITSLFGCHFALKDDKRQCWQISSISEVKYHKLLNKFPQQLVEIFKKSFVRIYPSGMRVDSSNYDPIKAFLSGSQIVALNFQTADVPMLLNQAKFQENGGFHSGYVLKPPFMLFDTPKTLIPNLLKKIVKTVKITIISGQQLRPENYEQDTFDVVDPYVQMFIRGTDFDEENNKPQLTSIISDNGFHPLWNSEAYEYNFACPELAMIIFRVMDSDVGADTLLGFYACPIDALREGYRVIPLRSKTSLALIEHSYILVKIEITELINRQMNRTNSFYRK